jgi:L-rhamnose 1-dehydrogenase
VKNKVVIVTGGSRGIGKATCIKFAKMGAYVVVNGFDNERHIKGSSDLVVKEITDFGGKAISYDCDISQKQNIISLFDKTEENFGNVDVLVANAGICPFENFLNINEDMFNKVVDVNQKGAFFCAQEAAKRMILNKIKGRIIFTSSVSSIFGGDLQSHYCATKGAVNQMMKSIAISVGKHEITSNAVLPGTVLTDINKKELKANPDLLNYFIKRTPIKRLVTTEEVAEAILFFANPKSSGISGASLIVDGGMSINLQ